MDQPSSPDLLPKEFLSLPSNLLPTLASPEWMNKADTAWKITTTTLVGLESVPGSVILYGSMVKKKWAVNSAAFMALHAFAAVLICWISWGHKMSFGDKLSPVWGKAGVSFDESVLREKSLHRSLPEAAFLFYEFGFAAITVILLAGSVLGRHFYAWMLFVPLWLTFAYTIGTFAI